MTRPNETSQSRHRLIEAIDASSLRTFTHVRDDRTHERFIVVDKTCPECCGEGRTLLLTSHATCTMCGGSGYVIDLAREESCLETLRQNPDLSPSNHPAVDGRHAPFLIERLGDEHDESLADTVRDPKPRRRKTCPDCRGSKQIPLAFSIATCDTCDENGTVLAD